MNYQYIYNANKKFDGCCQSTAGQGEDGNWYVNYTNPPELAEDYIKRKNSEVPGSNFVMVNWDDFYVLIKQYVNEEQGEWAEVTEEEYDYALGCLPPMKWHDLTEDINIFFISEAYHFSLHSAFIYYRKNGKYYNATRDHYRTDEDLTNDFLQFINNKQIQETSNATMEESNQAV